jgi:hypothetical protein
MKRHHLPATDVTLVAGYESESVLGQVWLVYRDRTGRLGCTCRGFMASKAAACIHTRTEAAREARLVSAPTPEEVLAAALPPDAA